MPSPRRPAANRACACRRVNPDATTIKCNSVITADEPELIAGKRALVVEDGPTLTHGGMTYGAGWFAAKQAGASEIVDAKPYAVGTIKATYEKFPNAGAILPAMGYGDQQVADLEETINATPADVVVEGTPMISGGSSPSTNPSRTSAMSLKRSSRESSRRWSRRS